jgi:hypothetical protein
MYQRKWFAIFLRSMWLPNCLNPVLHVRPAGVAPIISGPFNAAVYRGGPARAKGRSRACKSGAVSGAD